MNRRQFATSFISTGATASVALKAAGARKGDVVDVVTEVMPGHDRRFARVGGPCYPRAFNDTARVIVKLDSHQLSHVISANEQNHVVVVYDIDESGSPTLDASREDCLRAELKGDVKLYLEGTEEEHASRELREQNTRNAVAKVRNEQDAA